MSRFVVKDTYFKKAKQDGFRARSAYKLKEIQEKYRIVQKGNRVLDLGCAPGSFLQVISDIVGDQGAVIGIDILPVPQLPQKNIIAIMADIRDTDIKTLLEGISIDRLDVITCDIAPNLSGIREADDKNIAELYHAVQEVVKKALKPGGNFLIKSFFSDNFKDIDSQLKTLFRKVTVFKPAASRTVSSEIYFVCHGKRS
ncbi:MAG: RlmE family RNA methyltransferase [Syntrophus sp. (in: bacteria)]|nr:RlmE family RNA methyltransferase [Syntrophus sp. (in: bacteria)]